MCQLASVWSGDPAARGDGENAGRDLANKSRPLLREVNGALASMRLGDLVVPGDLKNILGENNAIIIRRVARIQPD